MGWRLEHVYKGPECVSPSPVNSCPLGGILLNIFASEPIISQKACCIQGQFLVTYKKDDGDWFFPHFRHFQAAMLQVSVYVKTPSKYICQCPNPMMDSCTTISMQKLLLPSCAVFISGLEGVAKLFGRLFFDPHLLVGRSAQCVLLGDGFSQHSNIPVYIRRHSMAPPQVRLMCRC